METAMDAAINSPQTTLLKDEGVSEQTLKELNCQIATGERLGYPG